MGERSRARSISAPSSPGCATEHPDSQFADLETRPRRVFELDDILAVIPSHWVHPQDAVAATAYHRTVLFDCEADVARDAAVLAEQQMRLLARYQPEGGR
jgi:hypothetical protein